MTIHTLASETDPITFALLGVTSINLGLAWVVIRAARREENRVFAFVAVWIALWTLTNALFRATADLALATLWAQISYLAAISVSAAFLHFAWIYPPTQRRIPAPRPFFSPFLLWLAAATVAASVFVPGFVIESIDVSAGRILTGPGITVVGLFILGVLVVAFATFFSHQRHLRRKARAQARYVLFGSFLTAVFGLTFNLALPLAGDYRFVWLGPMTSLFFVAFSVYSIVAHHLFDVRLLIRRTLVYTFLLAALAGAFAVLEKSLEYLLHPLLGGRDGFSTDLLAALVVGFGVDPLKRRLHHLATRALFRDESSDGEEN